MRTGVLESRNRHFEWPAACQRTTASTTTKTTAMETPISTPNIRAGRSGRRAATVATAASPELAASGELSDLVWRWLHDELRRQTVSTCHSGSLCGIPSRQPRRRRNRPAWLPLTTCRHKGPAGRMLSQLHTKSPASCGHSGHLLCFSPIAVDSLPSLRNVWHHRKHESGRSTEKTKVSQVEPRNQSRSATKDEKASEKLGTDDWCEQPSKRMVRLRQLPSPVVKRHDASRQTTRRTRRSSVVLYETLR